METAIVVTVLFVVTAGAILLEHKMAMAGLRRSVAQSGSCPDCNADDCERCDLAAAARGAR
jgi:hypothetical protein